MPKHFIVPDTQVKPGVPMEHLEWAGKYAAEKKPDIIVHIGDHADMQSLSSYDVGKKSFEGRKYVDDIEAAKTGMDLFLGPIRQEQERQRRNRERIWRPRLHIFLGNHEERILRAIEADRKLEGLISINDLAYERSGWTVHPYLEVAVLDGVAYSHYFTSGILGRPVTSARALVTKKHQSCVMGHVQKRDIAYEYTADGRQITGIFAGSFYQHDEDYLGPQGNKSWKGVWMLHDVRDGEFDEMPVSLNYLRKKYGGTGT